MSPQRLVATLLEADDMLPQPSPDAPDPAFDTKALTHRASAGIPLPVPGASIIGTYRDLARKFDQKRLRRDGPTEYFKVDNNTLLVRDTHTGNIAVKLHLTDIITVSPEDTLVVDVGRWHTMTSLSRINDWLPAGWRIYTCKGNWYWHNYRHSDEEQNPGFKRTQPYSNGDKITADGTLHPQYGPEFKKTRVAHRRDL
jgi:hypothetical protein